MSEADQLAKQREELQSTQETLQNWVTLKKNLQSKFKTPHEAFNGLKKQDKDQLSLDDFADYSKGLNLNDLFKDITLNEENFVKVWEQWEFKIRSNQHTLQMIDEKLELIGILDQKETKNYRDDPQSKKKILASIQNCEDLESLQQKLDTIVQTSQKQQPSELIQNEGDCFTQFLQKKSQIKQSELQISKIQWKEEEQPQKQSGESGELVESHIIQQGKVSGKKSYIDGSIAIPKSKGFNSSSIHVNSSKTYIFEQTKPSPKYYESSIEVPKSSAANLYKSPIAAVSKSSSSSSYEDNDQVRRSQKSRRMKGDLQNYIHELFQSDRDNYHTNKNNRGNYRQEPVGKGLSGFPLKKYFQQPQQDNNQFNNGNQIQNRVQSIRFKLNDFAQQKIQKRTSPYKQQQQQRPIEQKWTPTRALSVPKQMSAKSSPYTPGNTKRLNLDRLKQEKEIENHPQESIVEQNQQSTKIESADDSQIQQMP